MIGEQPTGQIAGVFIEATAHAGLRVTANGRGARLAIIADDGTILAAGSDVAREVEAVAVNAYRNLLAGQGHLRTLSRPLDADPAGAQEPMRRHNTG